MAKQVIWSFRAMDVRKNIFNYWKQRNKSNSYSKKLNHFFKEAIDIIKHFPQIGKPTSVENVRIKIVRDYLIVYEDTQKAILILSIWDGRQDTGKSEKILK